MLRPWLAALLHRWADRLVPPKPPAPMEIEGANLSPVARTLLERFAADSVAVIVIRETGLESYRRAYATGVAPCGRGAILAHELREIADTTDADAGGALQVAH